MSNEAAHVTVLLDEEYGYREWLWRTGMTEQQLADFWRNIPSMEPYFFSPKGLPGEVVLVEQGAKEGDDAYERRRDAIRKEAGGWTAHIHMDDDSALSRPDCTEILHAGYAGH
jgi:hypothetical protein